MTKKNDIYAPLANLGLIGAELEKAKARVRAAKNHFMRTDGVDAVHAELRALQAELERAPARTGAVILPKPPTGSGLSIRGVRNPQSGQNPMHWSFTIYDVSIRDAYGRVGKKRRIKFEEIDASITALFPSGIVETLVLKRRIETDQAGMMQRIEDQAIWIEKNKIHSDLSAAFIDARTKVRREKNRKTKIGGEATGLRVVFEFFLNPNENHLLPDVRQWQAYYDEFSEYLKVRPTRRRLAKRETLSKNTQKNYITTLNKYVAFVWKKARYQGVPPRCENYKKADLERRGVEALIMAEEEDAFVAHFRREDLPKVAAFMAVGNHIAARPGELLGLSLLDIIPGALPNDPKSATLKAMKKSLESIAQEHSLTVHGYVTIRGQLDGDSRQADGSLNYYPAKTVKTVEPKNYRYCPIVNAEVWQVLVELINEQRENYKSRRYGEEHERYLLFDGLSLAEMQEHFRAFRFGVGRKWGKLEHTPHCCRHTGCTWWVMMAGNNLDAAQKILGHTDPNETRHYSHLAELYVEELTKIRTKVQGDSFFDRFG